MKAAIVYQSVHHKNTQKIVEAMGENPNVDIYTVAEAKEADLSGYDLIGMASGVYGASMHKAILDFFSDFTLGENQKLFIVLTYTVHYANFEAKALKTVGADKQEKYIGSFGCKGFNTFGPFGWFGGAAKGHPDDKDVENAKAYIAGLVK
ncbi:MAG: flavodoxin [Lachnospiraceae bacterium]|nr:flavodoxin [Lachnospiraceae bacterium]